MSGDLNTWATALSTNVNNNGAAHVNTVQLGGNDPLIIEYHDKEWGVPVHDDRLLFEFLILEGAQAGLSWVTILRKRENYLRAFDNFVPADVATTVTRKSRNCWQIQASCATAARSRPQSRMPGLSWRSRRSSEALTRTYGNLLAEGPCKMNGKNWQRNQP